MCPFCVTRSKPTHQLTDPTQPNPLQVENLDPTRPNAIPLTMELRFSSDGNYGRMCLTPLYDLTVIG